MSPPLVINGNNLFIKSTNIDPQELRFTLLFWDKLVWPSSRNIHIPSGQDETYLESAKVLIRPEYTLNGDAGGLAAAQIRAYQDLEKGEPGCWALSQGENSFIWKDFVGDEGKGTLIELHRAIPVPKQDVPLAEILEFKERRRDELFLFRHQLEMFVSEIEQAPDKSQAFQQRLAELDQACADLIAVGREWQFPMYLSNIKSSLNFSPTKFFGAAAIGWKVAEPFGLSAATAAAAATGAASLLEIKADYGFRAISKLTSPYKYAYQIHMELR